MHLFLKSIFYSFDRGAFECFYISLFLYIYNKVVIVGMLGNCFSKIIIKKIILRVMRWRVKCHHALWTKLGTSFNGHTRASLDSS